MSNLISRSALIKDLAREYATGRKTLGQVIDEQPTIEAEPVVHGEWIFGTANHREYMKCSWCLHSQTPTGVFVYCPNCGARMDRGEL